jgi:hypothetical protein
MLGVSQLLHTTACVLVLALSCSTVPTFAADPFFYAGTLSAPAMVLDIQPPDIPPETTLLRVELNVTAAAQRLLPSPNGGGGLQLTPIPSFITVVMRDPAAQELTTLSSRNGEADAQVTLVCPTSITLPFVNASTNYSLAVTGTVGAHFSVKVPFFF